MTRDDITLIIAIIGVVTGVLGSVLALLNFVHNWSRERVKLRVRPVHAQFAMSNGVLGPPRLGIEVTNLSAFSVTVDQVGLLLKGRSDRLVFIAPLIADGSKLPKRLDPRTSMTAYSAPDAIQDRNVPIKCAFAKTECDVVRKGTSPALKHFIAKGNRF